MRRWWNNISRMERTCIKLVIVIIATWCLIFLLLGCETYPWEPDPTPHTPHTTTDEAGDADPCDNGYIEYKVVDGCWSRRDVCDGVPQPWKCLQYTNSVDSITITWTTSPLEIPMDFTQPTDIMSIDELREWEPNN